MEPVAFLIPRITGDLGVSVCVPLCVCASVCVCRMPHGPVSIVGQAEDGRDSQMNAGVWVSAALGVWVSYLVQHSRSEEPGWSPRSSVWRRGCWCPTQAGCRWSTLSPSGKCSPTQRSPLTARPLLQGSQGEPPSPPCSRTRVAFRNMLCSWLQISSAE